MITERPAPRAYYDITDSEAAHLRTRILAGERSDTGAGRPVLLRGATVITMDPEIGDLHPGDVLIKGEQIAGIGPDLLDVAGPDAVIVDMAGMIVMPGLIDNHRHCWQNAFRRLIADADLDTYVATTHGGMAMHYRPEDMHISVLATTLGAIDQGVTTVVDFSHNSRSGAHSDAVFDAYRESGIRAVHASAAPNAGAWEEQWPADLTRIRERHCGAADSRHSIRMGLDISRVRPVRELLSIARSEGLGITFDGVLGAGAAPEIGELAREGLLGPDVTLIHCTDLPDEVWRMLAASGTHVTLATTSDEQIGIATGLPPIQTALDHGIRPSLSVDVEISLAGDMFTQMRSTLMTQRMGTAMRRYRGDTDCPEMLTNRDVLEFATVQGARDNGLGAVTGSLTPGRAADIVALRAEDITNMPLNNAIGTIVQGVDASHVDTVFIAGRLRKWRRDLVGADIDAIRRRLTASRDHLADRTGWTVDPLRPAGNTRPAFDHLASFVDHQQHDLLES
ncbi:hypothetical protein AXA44_05700 [Rhodococcus sp. SC4]|uniref:amidohydrolase family protein n=1 Tax=Rhodococcus sp. LB1 TaxID=1807499 RepID=UPI00076A0F91|nr:amidohydrolase family protein [Rhodococcus sp. LB1]KXF54721.1 hypothetical protein AXA44_05700 [Rhodococcus sp. SC4]KXX55973.1 hypothetical protein AZG88_17000 [Rhodococcus sp. LB1]